MLGRLAPGPLGDGSVVLDRERARRAVEEVLARPLGLSPEGAALGVIRLLEQSLLQAVERMSIERGLDPRRFVLVAAGGAGPMHGARVGRALGCPRVHVPRDAGAFCALGMLHSDVRQDFYQVLMGRLPPPGGPWGEDGAIGERTLEEAFSGLEARARAWLEGEGFPPAAQALERYIEVRYRSQLWSVRVPWPDGPDGPDGKEGRADAVRARFEAIHERLYGHTQPGGGIEVTSVRVVGRAALAPLHRPEAEPAREAVRPEGTRMVVALPPPGHAAPSRGTAEERIEVPVYRGPDLRPGHVIPGPALVEEATTTVWVGPEDRLEVLPNLDFVIALPG